MTDNSLKSRANTLRERAASLKAELGSVNGQLSNIEANCRHQWTEPKKTHEPYVSFEADVMNPIARGSDLDYPVIARNRYRDAWTRECQVCGKVEQTTATKIESKAVPNF